jgi:hypothetical protein
VRSLEEAYSTTGSGAGSEGARSRLAPALAGVAGILACCFSRRAAYGNTDPKFPAPDFELACIRCGFHNGMATARRKKREGMACAVAFLAKQTIVQIASLLSNFRTGKGFIL